MNPMNFSFLLLLYNPTRPRPRPRPVPLLLTPELPLGGMLIFQIDKKQESSGKMNGQLASITLDCNSTRRNFAVAIGSFAQERQFDK